MNKIIVIVGGSAGALIASEIFKFSYEDVFFLETYSKDITNDLIIGDKILDGINFLEKKDVDYFIATGSNQQRKDNFELINSRTKKYPVNCIHPSAYLAPSSKIGYGNLICPLAVIHTNASVGNNTIINTGSIVEHDCKIADYSQISPNVTLCGSVEVNELSFIGAGSVVIPKIKIGRESIVAAGSSVISDVEDKKMYAGVPAKYKKMII